MSAKVNPASNAGVLAQYLIEHPIYDGSDAAKELESAKKAVQKALENDGEIDSREARVLRVALEQDCWYPETKQYLRYMVAAALDADAERGNSNAMTLAQDLVAHPVFDGNDADAELASAKKAVRKALENDGQIDSREARVLQATAEFGSWYEGTKNYLRYMAASALEPKRSCGVCLRS